MKLQEGRDIYPTPRGTRWKSVGKARLVRLTDIELNPFGLAIAQQACRKGGRADSGDDPVAVAKVDGRLYLLNGYHRVVLANLDGKESIMAQLKV